MTPRPSTPLKPTRQPATPRQQPETGAAPATAATPHAAVGHTAVGSVWPVAQTSSRSQRAGRYLPAAMAHPGKMLPALARTAIATYTAPGDLVLDPMCGIGTTLIEAVHAGRDAVGVEYEPHWADLARDGIDHAVDAGAGGHAAVATGDARHAPVLLGDGLAGRVRLLLTSPPYGASTHGRVAAPGAGKVSKWFNSYGEDRSNLAHRPLPELLDGLTDILRACLPLLASEATVVLTTRPYRHHGHLIDLPGAALHAAVSIGLEPVGRYVALLAGVRGGRLVPRVSFFQLANVRAARRAAIPLQAIAHEDVLVLRGPTHSTPGPAAPTPAALKPAAGTLSKGHRPSPPTAGPARGLNDLPKAA